MMKKLLACLLFVIMSISIHAQEMPSVAGVTFGMGIKACKEILDGKFTANGYSFQSTKNVLSYREVSIGGEFFDYCEFSFQESGGATFLSSVEFVRSLAPNEVEQAKSKRDKLFEVYRKKYEPRWEDVNENGFKYYVLGYRPGTQDGLLKIDVTRGKTNAGKERLWVTIWYFAGDFVDPTNDI